MSTLVMVGIIAVISVIVAWGVNSLIGLMSGDRPDDVAGDATDIFSRIIIGLEFGLIARLLDEVTGTPWVRRIVYVAVAAYLVKIACDYWIHH
ncbi:MAG: hypothetical protein JNN07_14495 [Verrucomicrobiales bacterium]|nr:hypothetical protein [Verrucomicrobiales bacterium]